MGLPAEFLDTMKALLGGEYEEYLQSFERESLQGIRVNTSKIDVDAFLQKSPFLLQNVPWTENGFYYEKQDKVTKHPYYYAGLYYVQEPSAMIPASRLPVEKGDFVLDLCAAPGGKCTHFAQKLGNKAMIEARDVSEHKIALIEENRERLGLSNIQEKVWDALVPDESRKEWADIVIADLPCSGFGILSHKNDIKYHMSEQQLLELANLQKTILTNAISYVKTGGLLLFSTCTINPEENRDNVKWMLDHYPLEPEPIKEHLPETLQPYVEDETLQLLPGVCLCDGFFIAKLRKKDV